MSSKDYAQVLNRALAAAGNPPSGMLIALDDDNVARFCPFESYEDALKSAGNGYKPYLQLDGWWYLSDGWRTLGFLREEPETSIEPAPVATATPIYVTTLMDNEGDSWTVFVHTDLELSRAAGESEQLLHGNEFNYQATAIIWEYRDGKCVGKAEQF